MDSPLTGKLASEGLRAMGDGRSRTRTWDLFLISVRGRRNRWARSGTMVTKYLLIADM